MKWLARTCSLLLTLVWLILAGLTVIAAEDPPTQSGRVLIALALLACAGLLLAWRRPQIGGAVAILAGIAFAVLASFAVPGSVTLVVISVSIGGAFVVTGLLFLAAAHAASAPAMRSGPATIVAALVTLLVLAMTLIPLGLGVSV